MNNCRYRELLLFIILLTAVLGDVLFRFSTELAVPGRGFEVGCCPFSSAAKIDSA